MGSLNIHKAAPSLGTPTQHLLLFRVLEHKLMDTPGHPCNTNSFAVYIVGFPILASTRKLRCKCQTTRQAVNP